MPKEKIMIEELISKNRLFALLSEEVINYKNYDEELYRQIQEYTEEYIEFEKKGEFSADNIYIKFIRSYNKDMKVFAKTKKYPLEINANRTPLNRYEYNIILLFSCLFTSHRFRIMQLIQQKSKQISQGLFIGCGPGIELELVKSKVNNLVAYDLTMDDFLYHKHPKIHFKEEYFNGKNETTKFDYIYLIEILEHLEKPYELLKLCKNSLSENGKIFLTTATNIPQFDHLFNFESTHEDFEKKIKEMNLSIVFMEDIFHHFILFDIKAKNRFYILKNN